MSNKTRPVRPKAALPRGLRDISGDELRQVSAMLATIARVYESYGFEPLATPALEFTDALGKFLPDADRPNEGVFSLQDEDERWMSLRYDLTAPLARHVAENFDRLPKPFRRYQTGTVWRNEKPGPGRYREFMQIDADTVGAETVAADAEMCMLAADALEALGIKRGDYVIRVNSRKIADGMLEVIGLEGEDNTARRLHVMRAIDKYERLGRQNVALLLGPGRKDESGDFTAGADLSPKQIDILLDYIEVQFDEASGDLESVFEDWARQASGSRLAEEGISELQEIAHLCRSAGYGNRRIDFDSSIVRGLEYYTGPVMEAELTFETTDENGHPVRFGSVGGGGRYDGLVERFRGQKVPATGFSIGVSRLYAALEHLGRHTSAKVAGPVVVLVMDQARRAEYQAMARELRAAGIRAEMYMGSSGMRAQMKYADKRGAPAVVIEGEDELARGEVTVKDLLLGAELSERIEDNREWREAQPAQTNVPRTGLVAEVRAVLARQGPGT